MPRAGIRMFLVRLPFTTVEAIVTFTIRARPLGGEVGEAEITLFANVVLDRFEDGNAGADYEEIYFGTVERNVVLDLTQSGQTGSELTLSKQQGRM